MCWGGLFLIGLLFPVAKWIPSLGAISSQISFTPLFAAALIGGAVLSPSIRRLFNSSCLRQLGLYSFPIYLSHLVVMCSLGSYLFVLIHNNLDLRLEWIAAVLSTAGLIFVVASALVPVERLAIRLSRMVGNAVLPKFSVSNS